MSLLFEHAVEVFDRDGASLVAASDAALATTETRIPVRPIAEFAAHHDSLTHPEEGWTCLPLHGPDDAVPTDEYVAYADHAVRGEVIDSVDSDDTVGGADGVTADTIDSFQGGEKTAVVLSLVRSNGEGDLRFLGRPEDGPRRLNVALTRAKRYRAVVADFHTLRYEAPGKCTDLYREFHDFFESTGRLNEVDPQFVPLFGGDRA